MGRPALQPDEISEFRDRLCDAALELFAEHGYDGFTLRALGDALDCSPTTPYRYFRDKGDIFSAVCARAFAELCSAQEAARIGVRDEWDGIRAQGRSYVAFSRANPHAYRVMFDLRETSRTRDLLEREGQLEPVRRSWALLRAAFVTAADAGELSGDPERLAFSFWASIHGVMSLELSGHLFVPVSGDELVGDIFERFERAYRPTRAATSSNRPGVPS